MSKIIPQNPGTSEVQSPLIAGITEALSKFSEILDLRTERMENVQLLPVPIDEQSKNKNRIYEAPTGYKLWLNSPMPVFEKNGAIITQSANNFSVDYVGGSITFDSEIKPADKDVITVSGTHIINGSQTISSMLASIQNNAVQANKYKGAHSNVGALKKAFPTAKDGDFAVVLDPPAMFVWSSAQWKDSRSIEDLSDFYKKNEVNSLLAKKENSIVAHGSTVADDDYYYGGRKTWQNTSEKVRNTKLTGFSTSSDKPVSTSDSVLSAIGKLQAQTAKAANSHYIQGTGEPTASTKGAVGQRYMNTSNGDWYTCTESLVNQFGDFLTTWKKGVNSEETKVFSCSVSAKGWNGPANGVFSKTENCPGMKSSYNCEPFWYSKTGSTETDKKLSISAYSLSDGYIETLENALKFTVKDVPVSDIVIYTRRSKT